jgi:hypothetical protein
MKEKSKKGKALDAKPTVVNRQKVVLCDEWLNFNTYEKSVYTNLSIIRLGKEVIAWARNNPDAIKIGQFLEEKGIGRRSWNRWCENYPDLQEAYEHAKMIIGNRREFGALTRKYDSGYVSKTQITYCEDYKEALRETAAITNKELLNSGNRVVVIERYPDSPLVPHKKEQE